MRSFVRKNTSITDKHRKSLQLVRKERRITDKHRELHGFVRKKARFTDNMWWMYSGGGMADLMGTDIPRKGKPRLAR